MREKNIEEYTRQYPYPYCTVYYEVLTEDGVKGYKNITVYVLYTARSWNNLLFVQLFIYNQYSYNHSFNNQSSYNHSFYNQSSNNHSLNNQSSYNHSFNTNPLTTIPLTTNPHTTNPSTTNPLTTNPYQLIL